MKSSQNKGDGSIYLRALKGDGSIYLQKSGDCLPVLDIIRITTKHKVAIHIYNSPICICTPYAKRTSKIQKMCYNAAMKVIRTQATLKKASKEDDSFVSATAAERISFMWELTAELWSLKGSD